MGVGELRKGWTRLIFLTPLLALAVAVGLALIAVRPALAQSQEKGEVKPCASCHSDEAEIWQDSAHATSVDPATGLPAAACESCHGAYERGHPDEAMATLRVDSSSCQDCHADTYEQWQTSMHGAEGVQCISCHLPHSQQMRLTDEGQCKACHQEALEDPLHSAHWSGDAACTDCHMANTTVGVALAAADPALAALTTPSHDFVGVSAVNCLECHREDVTLTRAEGNQEGIAVRAALAEAPILAAKLEGARQDNRSLTVLSVANLGFGIGVGGILGIAFMVILVRINRRGR